MTDASWVRAPRQARSQATLERFVEATLELLKERSFEEITIADIVAGAERTVGSFYARFEDKDALLHLLVQRLDQRVGEVVRAFCDPVRWDGAPVGEFVEQAVLFDVHAYRSASPLFRAAMHASMTDGRFRAQRQETMRFCADQQKRFLLTRRDELHCADPSRASDRMFELVIARLEHHMLLGRFTETSPDDDLELAGELRDESFAILGIAGSAGSDLRTSLRVPVALRERLSEPVVGEAAASDAGAAPVRGAVAG